MCFVCEIRWSYWHCWVRGLDTWTNSTASGTNLQLQNETLLSSYSFGYQMELQIPCITCAQDCNGLPTIFPVLLICFKNNNKGVLPCWHQSRVRDSLGACLHECRFSYLIVGTREAERQINIYLGRKYFLFDLFLVAWLGAIWQIFIFDAYPGGIGISEQVIIWYSSFLFCPSSALMLSFYLFLLMTTMARPICQVPSTVQRHLYENHPTVMIV
jgi:hypothetical protein